MKWDPEDYAKNSSAQLGWAREIIARLELNGAEALLDIGCGDGKVTAEFAAAVPHGYVLGIDNSPEFIEYATAHFPVAQYPNLKFRVMDARQLDADRRFDLIFSNAALHWVDDHPAVLRRCARLLQPDGRLIISCGGAGNAADIVSVMEEMMVSARWNEYFKCFTFPYFFYSPSDYQLWLPAAGLRTKRLELTQKDMIHSGAQGMAGWLRTTWFPFIQCIPQALQETFIQEVVACYLQTHPLDASGNSHIKMVRLEVEAVKVEVKNGESSPDQKSDQK